MSQVTKRSYGGSQKLISSAAGKFGAERVKKSYEDAYARLTARTSEQRDADESASDLATERQVRIKTQLDIDSKKLSAAEKAEDKKFATMLDEYIGSSNISDEVTLAAIDQDVTTTASQKKRLKEEFNKTVDFSVASSIGKHIVIQRKKKKI